MCVSQTGTRVRQRRSWRRRCSSRTMWWPLGTLWTSSVMHPTSWCLSLGRKMVALCSLATAHGWATRHCTSTTSRMMTRASTPADMNMATHCLATLLSESLVSTLYMSLALSISMSSTSFCFSCSTCTLSPHPKLISGTVRYWKSTLFYSHNRPYSSCLGLQRFDRWVCEGSVFQPIKIRVAPADEIILPNTLTGNHRFQHLEATRHRHSYPYRQ